MATDRTFGNMLNQKPATKKPLKETKPQGDSIWAKMMKKEK